MGRTHVGFRIAMSAILAMSVWHTQALQVYAQQASGAADAVASAIASQQAPASETATTPETVTALEAAPEDGAASAVADSLAAVPAPATPDAATTPAPATPTAPATPAAPAAPATLVPQASDPVTVTTWSELQTAVNESTDNRVITLLGDIVADGDSRSIRVEDWQSLTIDLNGFALNRNLGDRDDDNGHVIDVYRGTLTIRDSSANKTGTIRGGNAENGGGIVVSGSGHLNFESGTVTGNYAYNGGGIYVYPADGSDTGIQLSMTGGSVTSNVGGDCGGVYTRGNSELSNVTITDNSTQGAGGGGFNNKGTSTVANCTISRNVADQGGGGIYNDGNLTLSNTTISENTSKDNGGGINSHNTLAADTCIITSNNAAKDGGGVYAYGSNATFTNSTINNNKAEASGGALRSYGGTVELNHTTLNRNEATEYGGGIYCNNEGLLKLLNSTSITECIGYKGGGGVFVASAMAQVQVGSGVIVTGNQANNIYLTNGKTLNVVEKLQAGTAIGVSLENYGGTFTTGYNDTSSDVDPSSVFVAEPGYSVIKDAGNGEARILTSDWIGLQTLIDETVDGGLLILERSWQAVDENLALNIPAGKKITIDLNGYTIDRHRGSFTDDGEVITVNGELSIVDNSYEKKGSIKGGYGQVGGVRVNGGGTFKFQSGNITGNHSTLGGGGVRVFGDGKLETYGGVISGNTSDTDGGGVYNEGTFTNAVCNITNNTASGNGAGVYTLGATTFNSGDVSSNKANGSGGGACVGGGTLSIKGGSISSNTANGGGAGLYVTKGSATIEAGEIVGNSAGTDGGGMYICSDGSVSLKAGTITGNYANYGGGIYVELSISDPNGRLSVSGAPQVTQNVATIGKNILLSAGGGNGNAMTIDGTLDPSKARLDVMTLDNTQALTNGYTTQGCELTCFTTKDADQSQLEVREDGELYIKQAEGGVRVSNWRELQNAIDNAGSGTTIVLNQSIWASEDDVRLIVEDGKNLIIDLNGYVLNRHLDKNEGSDGHVIEVDEDSTLTIQDTVGTGEITGGYADNGGGMYIHDGSTVNMLGGVITSNRADEDGGGVYARGTFNATGGAIVHNRADDNGGGVYAEHDGNLNLSKMIIANNTSHNEGGGVDVRVDRTDTKLTECQIRDNNAENDHGGGVYLNKSSLLLTLENCDVQGNHSDNGHKGGGIYVDDGRLTVNGGTISNNRSQDGGGVYNDECAVVLSGTTLSGNSTYDHGGAGVSNHGSCQLYNCIFMNNTADGEGGAVYSVGYDYLRAENCTFVNNKSNNESGGAICTGHATVLTKCTFTNNSAHSNGGALCAHRGNGKIVIGEGMTYEGEIVVDGGTFSGNSAAEYGGGIVCNEDSTVHLKGNAAPLSITNNTSSLGGSGVHVAHDMKYISLAGNVTIKDNDMENDFYLGGDKCVDILDVLDGSQIRVVLERGTGTFTTNLKNYLAAGVDPATIFLAKTGQWVIPTSDNEAQVVASDWPMLQKLIDDTPQDGTLTLAGEWNRDWKAAPENVALQIASGKKITIDLNGHTIDRARPNFQEEGQVFNVAGELTIRDTSEGGYGKICGANGNGGGIVVQEGAKLNLQSGYIQDNHAKHGGGIRVKKGGSLSITGGVIQNNTADASGGGVYVDEYNAWTGEVSCDWFGGTITKNTAHASGGGMWLGQNVNFQMGGNLNVSNNIASSGANLYQGAGTTLNITRALDQNSRIDFIAESPNRALTSGLTSTGGLAEPLSVFTYNGTSGGLVIRDGELWIAQTEAAIAVSDWQALQQAINDEANRDKVIRLASDITASDGEDRLLLDQKSVIVDLNGHKLDRHLDDDKRDGHVFEVLGGSTLTIRDTAGAGRITGGYAKHGGAINIAGDSTCIVEGGTFTGNRASDEGGAFYVYGKLVMTGGVITENTTDSGGGIFVDSNGTIELTNVTIVNNKAEKWGGGAINNKGNATLTNCTIKENWADNEGGAIYNATKQLTLEGCTITNNSSSGGGGLCCYGTVNINNTTISNNYGDDYGGGLYTRGVVTITNSHINNNSGKTDGGGIYNQGGLLTVTDTEFAGNTTEAGGGALNNKGTATLTNCTMTGNHANSEGGCIYEGVDGATTIDGCDIQYNSCGKDGGGVSACGVMSISNSTISQNTAEKGGGGVYSYGDTTITNTTVNNNTAKETGAGVLTRNRSLTLDSATITENAAESTGGGVMVEGGSGAVVLKGTCVIRDNSGAGDVYLTDGHALTIGAPLATDAGKTDVWVQTAKGMGVVFTTGYSDYCAGTDPAEYFSSNDGFQVYLEGNEASTRVFTKEDESFIDPGSQVNPNVGTLTGVDWMSGISGERRLNEINMPGTHDSATARVVGNLTTGSTLRAIAAGTSPIDLGGTILSTIASLFGKSFPSVANEAAEYFSTFANCQTRYIDQQLVDGIRSIDLRCNTYKVDPGYPPRPKEDNGEDLYLCHGKTEKGGTFYAYDERVSNKLDPDFITYREVLQWVKTFLEEHPTECIMMNVQVECVDDVQDLGIARIKKHIHEELATQINPSTGKPYLYMQDGVFGRLYTEYPKLKDCRGQVVLDCGDDDAEILGGLKKGVGLDRVERPDGSYKDNASQKIANLRRFFANHGYDDLPTSANEHLDFIYSVGLNGTDSRSIPQVTPLQIAKEVKDAMFNSEDGLIINKAGKYLGLINMDAETAKVSKIVWESNFFNTLQYCNVTTRSGFGEEVVDTSQVMYGTKITIPDCIYANPNSEGKYFQTWQGSMDNSVSGNTWNSDPGESFTVTGDTTFTATWGDQNTPVSVMWRDAENADGLRPEQLSISYRGSDTPVDLVPDKNWKLALPGSVQPADITVNWDRIGEDAEGTYACNIHQREGGIGIVIELTHTPKQTVNPSGTIHWSDNDDQEGIRPENVTIHLVANSRVIDSMTVSAEDNWAWDFGEHPTFIDGEEVQYSVEEDAVEGYETYVKGFDITNVLGGAKQYTSLSGMVFWTDNNNTGHTRPKSVTVNLLKDGEQVDSKEVTQDDDGRWYINFTVPGTYEEGSYSATQDPIEGYNTIAYPMTDTAASIVISNVLEEHEHTHETKTTTLLEPTCTTKGVRMVVDQCKECGEVFSATREEIPELGHDWGDWEVIVEATETRMGYERRTCKRDGNHVEVRTIPKVGHTHALVHVSAIPATCTEDGINEHWVCSGGDDPCGLCFADAEGTEWIHEEATVAHALGHDWGDWEVVTPATETSEGLEKRTCKHDSSHVETRVTPVLEHTHGLVHVDAVEPTCTRAGNIEYWRCVEGDNPCGLLFADAGGKAQISERDIVVPATGHNWGSWRMTKAPTESEYGEEVRVCHNDPSHTQTRNIPKVGHTHVLSRVEAKPATCTEDGNREYWQCTEGDNPCGLIFADKDGHEQITLEDTVIPASGHDWNSPTYEWAPDNSSVTAQRVCKHCSEVESQTMSTTSVVTREPQLGVPGQTTYMAIFPNLAFRPQRRAVDDIPALTGVAYVGNGATSGSMDIVYGDAGATVTLAPCAYKRTGYDFVGWNTRADGSGTTLMPGAPFALSAGGDWLFAQWRKVQPKASQVMYRLYNPNSGEHFYTASVVERDAVAAAGWTYEGVGWTAPLSGAPVYRLYNPNAGDHHYTINAAERDALVGVGWLDEGIGWRSAGLTGKPVWREYNPNAHAGAHNFTMSKNEHLTLVSKGWHGEGIAWYGL